MERARPAAEFQETGNGGGGGDGLAKITVKSRVWKCTGCIARPTALARPPALMAIMMIRLLTFAPAEPQAARPPAGERL